MRSASTRVFPLPAPAAMATLPGASSQIVGFGDRGVAVVSLLAQDLESTRAWVCEVLGGLADDTPNAAMLRHTLSVFLSTKESHLHTAEQLNLHRNTVKYRIGESARLPDEPRPAARAGYRTASDSAGRQRVSGPISRRRRLVGAL